MSRSRRALALPAFPAPAPAPAPAPSSGSPAPPRSKRKARESGRSLAEGALSGEDPQAELAEQQRHRALYEKIAAPMLWPWLTEFGTRVPKARQGDREWLITTLVAGHLAPPRPGKEIAEYVACWRRVTKAGKRTPAPAVFFGDAPAPAAPAQEQQSDEEGHSAPASSEAEEGEASSEEDDAPPPAKKSRATHAVAAAPRATAASFMGMDARAAAASSQALGVSPRAASSAARFCLTCAAPAPAFAVGGAPFRCTECSRRGDLEFDHAINVALMADLGRAAPAASSSGSSSAGQSQPSTHTAAAADSHLTKLERHFERELKRTPAQKGAFARGTAPEAFTHQQAITEVRKAFKASQTEAPAAQLVELIRAGGLLSVGFAIPRSLSQARKDDDSSATALTLVQGVIISGGAVAAPPVESLQSFCAALFSTILPALADNPRAIAQWCALGRTALEFERDGGSWSFAQAYIDQLLNERITMGAGEYASVSDGVRIAVQSSMHAPAAPRGGMPQQQQQSGAGAGQKIGGAERQVCRRYNLEQCAGPCPRRHVCWARACRAQHPLSKCPIATAADRETLSRPPPSLRMGEAASVRSAVSTPSRKDKRAEAPADA